MKYTSYKSDGALMAYRYRWADGPLWRMRKLFDGQDINSGRYGQLGPESAARKPSAYATGL